MRARRFLDEMEDIDIDLAEYINDEDVDMAAIDEEVEIETLPSYTLNRYLDVWGNPETGWTVNSHMVFHNNIVVEEDKTDKEILEFLKLLGFIDTSDRRIVQLVKKEYGWEIIANKGDVPMGSLAKNED